MCTEVDDVSVYVNWLLYAVVGRMGEADSLMRQYGAQVRSVAAALGSRAPVSDAALHRGLLLEPELVADGVLAADSRLTYLSFSESPSVARWFADPSSAISEYVRRVRPRAQGYLVEHRPAAGDVLFHHRWAAWLPLLQAAQMHPSIDAEQFAWNLHTQEEVVVSPPQAPFRVVPYHPAETAALDELLTHPHFRAK